MLFVSMIAMVGPGVAGMAVVAVGTGLATETMVAKENVPTVAVSMLFVSMIAMVGPGVAGMVARVAGMVASVVRPLKEEMAANKRPGPGTHPMEVGIPGSPRTQSILSPLLGAEQESEVVRTCHPTQNSLLRARIVLLGRVLHCSIRRDHQRCRQVRSC